MSGQQGGYLNPNEKPKHASCTISKTIIKKLPFFFLFFKEKSMVWSKIQLFGVFYIFGVRGCNTNLYIPL